MAVTLSRLDHHGKLRWSNWLRYFGCWLISNSTQTSGNAGKDLGLFSSCYTPNSVGWSEDSLASMTQTIWFGVWVKNSCNYSAKHRYKITQPADVTSLLWVFFFCERHSYVTHCIFIFPISSFDLLNCYFSLFLCLVLVAML